MAYSRGGGSRSKGGYQKKKQEPRPAPVRLQRNWSEYQQNVFREIEQPSNQGLNVVAVPGSGKSTTLIEGLYHIPSGHSAIMVAFNKSIADENAARVPQGVESKTCHSLGLRIIVKTMGQVTVDRGDNKNWNIANSIYGEEKETVEKRYNLIKSMRMAKSWLAESHEEIDSLIDKYEIEAGDSEDERSEFVSNTINGLNLSALQKKIINFDDMIWFVHKFNLKATVVDEVLGDEAQDWDRGKRELMIKAAGKRLIICGDPYQAINIWAGADQNSMDEVAKATNAKVLPLSVSYRCARSIVELAKGINPAIEPAENAPDGIVEKCDKEQMFKEAGIGDFILSRVNAPLVSLCLRFLKDGRKANIQGSDMGKALVSMIKKSKATDVNGFLVWLDKWRDIESERLEKKHRDVTPIFDKADCMISFCEGINSLDEVIKNIEQLFVDDRVENRITLSSVHKAKGREADRVWYLHKTCRPERSDEEKFIHYVAITRAKQTLMLVE